jgi:hypothetical protein
MNSPCRVSAGYLSRTCYLAELKISLHEFTGVTIQNADTELCPASDASNYQGAAHFQCGNLTGARHQRLDEAQSFLILKLPV